MPRLATSQIHLLNLCLMHEAEPKEMIGLLALEAFAQCDMERLNAWVAVGELEQDSNRNIPKERLDRP